MKSTLYRSLIMALNLVVVGLFVSWPLGAQDVPRITTEELNGLLGNSDVIVLDVRESQNWQDSEVKIKGAVRGHPGQFSSWADQYPKDKKLVLY
jgi:rhodanese-related sulfurtransferase